jgi:type I restriction enzyme, S subunit
VIFGDHTREIKYIDFDFIAGADGVKVLKPLNGYEKYFYLVFKSLKLEDRGYSRHYKILSKYSFPLPPLAEQHRIVSTVDRLMALCDELEVLHQHEQAGCLKLGIANLVGLQNAESPDEFGRQWMQVFEAFDLILDCPENVEVLRQTILQLAVQGKLNRKEKEEKIVIKCVKLGEVISDITIGLDRSKIEQNSEGKGIQYIKMNNITNNGKFDLTDAVYVNVNQEESEKYGLKFGDIIFNTRNSYELVGKNTVIPDDKIPRVYNNNIARIRLKNDINPFFLSYQLNSVSFRNSMRNDKKATTNVCAIYLKDLLNTTVLIPPIAEQHRIVSNVDILMMLCDQLAAHLKELVIMQTKFLDAVVKNVGMG